MDDALLVQAMGLDEFDVGRLVVIHGARGAGKTWCAERAAVVASLSGVAVRRLAGRVATIEQIDELLAGLDDVESVCVVVDDLDHLDAERRTALRVAIGRAGSVGVFTTASVAAVDAATSLRLDPFDEATIVNLLAARGVAPVAARRCAAAARGNPGLAVALAEGLSTGQRADRAPVPELPRLATEIASELQSRLRDLSETSTRALVVAAADDEGDVGTITAALALLGETVADPFDEVERAGIIEITGARLEFADPWIRLAAYHVLAPASRRAAHRALAECCTAPRHAERRVRHLVAACDGPNDEVADALLLVAAAAARRRGPITAAEMAMRGAELAVSHELRRSCLLSATGWFLDGGSFDRADAVADQMDGDTDDEQWAATEVRALLRGSEGPVPLEHDPGGNARSWRTRHLRRRTWWNRALGGDHRGLPRDIELATSAPAEDLAAALSMRHAGNLREASDLVDGVLEQLPSGPSHVRDRFDLVKADLVALAGRSDVAVQHLEGRRLSRLDTEAATFHDRCTTALDPTRAWLLTAISFEVPEPLHSLRSRLVAAVTAADPLAAVAVADSAAELSLPIEAGEARLIAAELALERSDIELARACADEATTVLQRCGVRMWDKRLRAVRMACAVTPVARVAPADPALDQLTAAERRVADAVASGATNREVAASLFLSVKTVDFHLQQIYRKLGIRSRTELAVRVSGRQGALG